jgi:hypothetical protein
MSILAYFLKDFGSVRVKELKYEGTSAFITITSMKRISHRYS